jgi:hypothetical protein
MPNAENYARPDRDRRSDCSAISESQLTTNAPRVGGRGVENEDAGESPSPPEGFYRRGRGGGAGGLEEEGVVVTPGANSCKYLPGKDIGARRSGERKSGRVRRGADCRLSGFQSTRRDEGEDKDENDEPATPATSSAAAAECGATANS